MRDLARELVGQWVGGADVDYVLFNNPIANGGRINAVGRDGKADRNAEIILYCGGGYRSALSADALGKMGYTNVFSMDGGWRQWVEAGNPVDL